jgi:hypothetical protein
MIFSFLNSIFVYNKTNNNITNNITNNNKIDNKFKKLPYELKNIIFEYDGRIEYRYKKKNAIDYHKFVNIIHKYDERYNVITPIIHKKQQIMTDTEMSPDPVNTRFYFEFAFDNQPNLILCYDYNWSYNNHFEICYTDMKGSGHVLGSDQIRTIYK